MFIEICLSEKDLVKALLGASVVCSLFFRLGFAVAV